MNTQFKNIWQKIDGYKTIGSVALWLILRGIKLAWPHSIPDEWVKWIEDVLFFTGGIGVGHKIEKTVSKP